MKVLIKFDKNNKQEDYLFMAREKETGKLKIGYIVVDKPWQSQEKDWKYFIFYNKYNSNGFCGGSSDEGILKCEVLSDTIEPYTQISKIKYNKERGFTSVLVNDIFDYILDHQYICEINTEDKIPYELWS